MNEDDNHNHNDNPGRANSSRGRGRGGRGGSGGGGGGGGRGRGGGREEGGDGRRLNHQHSPHGAPRGRPPKNHAAAATTTTDGGSGSPSHGENRGRRGQSGDGGENTTLLSHHSSQQQQHQHQHQQGAPRDRHDSASSAHGTDARCVVCSGDIDYGSVGVCNHPICFTCSVRLRHLLKKSDCPVCRTVMSVVYLTKAFASASFEELGKVPAVPLAQFSALEQSAQTATLRSNGLPSFFIAEGSICYEDRAILDKCHRMFEFVCPLCPSTTQPFASLRHLKDHLKSAHNGLQYCDLCVKNQSKFLFEQPLYSSAELLKHRRSGDGVPYGAASADSQHRSGHPKCEFCSMSLYDNDALYLHLKKIHVSCAYCPNVYYKNVESLEDHFRDEHYLCEDPKCLKEKVGMFGNEMDFRAHIATAHMGNASNRERKRTLVIPFTFAYSGSSNPNTGSFAGGQRNIYSGSKGGAGAGTGASGGSRNDAADSSDDDDDAETEFSLTSSRWGAEQFPALSSSATTSAGSTAATTSMSSAAAQSSSSTSSSAAALPSQIPLGASAAYSRAAHFSKSAFQDETQFPSLSSTARSSAPPKQPSGQPSFSSLASSPSAPAARAPQGSSSSSSSSTSLSSTAPLPGAADFPALSSSAKHSTSTGSAGAFSKAVKGLAPAPPQPAAAKSLPISRFSASAKPSMSTSTSTSWSTSSSIGGAAQHKSQQHQHHHQQQSRSSDDDDSSAGGGLSSDMFPALAASSSPSPFAFSSAGYSAITGSAPSSKVTVLSSAAAAELNAGTASATLKASQAPPSLSDFPSLGATAADTSSLSSAPVATKASKSSKGKKKAAAADRQSRDEDDGDGSGSQAKFASFANYVPPSTTAEHNAALIRGLKEVFQGDQAKFDGFKAQSGAFLRGEMTASEYYSVFCDFLGDKVDSVFPDLVGSLTDLTKQQQLSTAHFDAKEKRRGKTSKPGAGLSLPAPLPISSNKIPTVKPARADNRAPPPAANRWGV